MFHRKKGCTSSFKIASCVYIVKLSDINFQDLILLACSEILTVYMHEACPLRKFFRLPGILKINIKMNKSITSSPDDDTN